jgi:hypothetical protein
VPVRRNRAAKVLVTLLVEDSPDLIRPDLIRSCFIKKMRNNSRAEDTATAQGLRSGVNVNAAITRKGL